MSKTKKIIQESKLIEKKLDFKLEKEFYIVRLDWKWFSKFTRKFFKKPYDEKLNNIMQNITEFLFSEFNAKLWYTQSDEITLVFKKWIDDTFFNWRIQKIVSVLSWKASSILINELYKKWLNEAVLQNPCFDARVFETNNIIDVYESVKSRYFDCLRNSKLNLAMFLWKKERLNKSWDEIIKLVKEKLDYYTLPISYRKWTFFIKEKQEVKNPFYEKYKKYNPQKIIIRNVVKKINIEKFPEFEDFENTFNINFMN